MATCTISVRIDEYTWDMIQESLEKERSSTGYKISMNAWLKKAINEMLKK